WYNNQVHKPRERDRERVWATMAMALKQIFSNSRKTLPLQPNLAQFLSTQYAVKVGILEFLNGVGKGVETHAAKLETEIGDFQKLLVTRTLKLKKLGVPCKHVIQTLLIHLYAFFVNYVKMVMGLIQSA
ncbi:hypothetical protein GIB67_008292, partial [Kingdonia uniflora]